MFGTIVIILSSGVIPSTVLVEGYLAAIHMCEILQTLPVCLLLLTMHSNPKPYCFHHALDAVCVSLTWIPNLLKIGLYLFTMSLILRESQWSTARVSFVKNLCWTRQFETISLRMSLYVPVARLGNNRSAIPFGVSLASLAASLSAPKGVPPIFTLQGVSLIL